MHNHLQSKTVMGLIALLVMACVMSYCGKLTPELVDIFKWVGMSYMAVRGAANVGESFGKNSENKPK
jgi:hypothetical protein